MLVNIVQRTSCCKNIFGTDIESSEKPLIVNSHVVINWNVFIVH